MWMSLIALFPTGGGHVVGHVGVAQLVGALGRQPGHVQRDISRRDDRDRFNRREIDPAGARCTGTRTPVARVTRIARNAQVAFALRAGRVDDGVVVAAELVPGEKKVRTASCPRSVHVRTAYGVQGLQASIDLETIRRDVARDEAERAGSRSRTSTKK